MAGGRTFLGPLSVPGRCGWRGLAARFLMVSNRGCDLRGHLQIPIVGVGQLDLPRRAAIRFRDLRRDASLILLSVFHR